MSDLTPQDLQDAEHDCRLWGLSKAQLTVHKAAERIAELEASLAAAVAAREAAERDAKELWKALNDLSFECDGGIGAVSPTINTYNRTFLVMDSMRGKYAARKEQP